jgi:hypothetical protein
MKNLIIIIIIIIGASFGKRVTAMRSTGAP